jgi:hypothetical protein
MPHACLCICCCMIWKETENSKISACMQCELLKLLQNQNLLIRSYWILLVLWRLLISTSKAAEGSQASSLHLYVGYICWHGAIGYGTVNYTCILFRRKPLNPLKGRVSQLSFSQTVKPANPFQWPLAIAVACSNISNWPHMRTDGRWQPLERCCIWRTNLGKPGSDA